jgi:DNA-binding NarL/FixJ family response regulator
MPPTVVIVDDHPSFRASARALLESEGFEVLGEADSGAAAAEAVERCRPRLVLLDVQLPDADGFALAGRLIANGKGPDVILVSSRAREDLGPQLARSGARGFIQKSELSAESILELLP